MAHQNKFLKIIDTKDGRIGSSTCVEVAVGERHIPQTDKHSFFLQVPVSYYVIFWLSHHVGTYNSMYAGTRKSSSS